MRHQEHRIISNLLFNITPPCPSRFISSCTKCLERGEFFKNLDSSKVAREACGGVADLGAHSRNAPAVQRSGNAPAVQPRRGPMTRTNKC